MEINRDPQARTFKLDDHVSTLQARKGDFYTHLFADTDDELAQASLCGLDRGRFYASAGHPTVAVALSGRSDVCGRCARVLRSRV